MKSIICIMVVLGISLSIFGAIPARAATPEWLRAEWFNGPASPCKMAAEFYESNTANAAWWPHYVDTGVNGIHDQGHEGFCIINYPYVVNTYCNLATCPDVAYTGFVWVTYLHYQPCHAQQLGDPSPIYCPCGVGQNCGQQGLVTGLEPFIIGANAMLAAAQQNGATDQQLNAMLKAMDETVGAYMKKFAQDNHLPMIIGK